ncbi:unnamed protein product [Acanthoscelides obtectus]|uniref:Uncharacterized protein n=1 Tax=Acanthoscelides obtectus TaxID=200917 RepID=A0A9P0QCN8_ACAOB|nr:unnamed protein product [Acanthoscelides obtectus]CAK1629802.1 hypothetical protein AOBTE_LOCUS5963 [Acanthoscelides obtectus]
MQDKKSKKKENKRSIFQLCFPCIGKQTFSCDEVMCDSFGREFTEYEYVIEKPGDSESSESAARLGLVRQEVQVEVRTDGEGACKKLWDKRRQEILA